MKPPDRKIEVIRAVPAFGTCPRSELTLLGQLLEMTVVEPDIRLGVEGDLVRFVYIVLEGRVRLEWRTQRVGAATSGDCVAAADLLDSGRHRFTAVTEGPTSVLAASRGQFGVLVARSDAFRRYVMVGLARQTRPNGRIAPVSHVSPVSLGAAYLN